MCTLTQTHTHVFFSLISLAKRLSRNVFRSSQVHYGKSNRYEIQNVTDSITLVFAICHVPVIDRDLNISALSASILPAKELTEKPVSVSCFPKSGCTNGTKDTKFR